MEEEVAVPSGRDGLTVRNFVKSVAPDMTCNLPWSWLFWPPDTFAFTSLIFQRTGCHGFVLSEEWRQDKESETECGWAYEVEHSGRKWTAKLSSLLSGKDKEDLSETSMEDLLVEENGSLTLLHEHCKTINELAGNVTMEQLRVLTSANAGRDKKESTEDKAHRLCKALIFLHAVADEACSGFGLPVSPEHESALVHCLANLLLTTSGSLSTIPQSHGIVLPKLRTPQRGLTLRSLSHHLTFHSSEVEVMWRATPWSNIEENTLNILCFPWPEEVDEQCFHPERETFESVRYFRFDPPGRDNSAYLDNIVTLTQSVNGRVGRVHLLMFPESALTKREYEGLLWRLWQAHQKKLLSHVPLVVAGVRHHDPHEGNLNEVRLAAYFASRWYQLSQHKHHRWRIDRHQIRQYQLEGRLPTPRDWYESIPVTQRRLTFMAQNDWLTLCPLICEDLAQLEPVSELVRGVGPTLLLALLQDGPQLPARWPARYASVLADDPGTAVLTLTSIGMATRSRLVDSDRPNEPPRRTVALWKDQIKGARTIDLDEGSDAVLLTISSDWTEEFTADGRGDHGYAATFKFEGVRQLSFSELPKTNAEWPWEAGSSWEKTPPWDEILPWNRVPPEVKKLPSQEPKQSRRWLATWTDTRELTAATYVLDAAIQLGDKDVDTVVSWLLGDVDPVDREHLPGRLSSLIELLKDCEKDPFTTGIASPHESKSEWPTKSLKYAGATARELLQGSGAGTENKICQWRGLAKRAICRLDPPEPRDFRQAESQSAAESGSNQEEDWDARWVRKAFPLAVLGALHNRVEKLRRRPQRQHGQPDPQQIVANLTKAADFIEEIEDALRRHN